MPIRLIPHEESFEVRFPDPRESHYFYFDDNPGRRTVTRRMSREDALEAAKSFALSEREADPTRSQPAGQAGAECPQMNTSTVGMLVVATFTAARMRFPDVQEKWGRASYRTGSQILESDAAASIQRIGEIDVICRALEDELVAEPSQPGEMDFRFHYLVMMSELWVSQAYAICFALKNRGLMADEKRFEQLAQDLRLVRVQLEKYQIPSDRELTDPLPMTTDPSGPGGAPERFSLYDRANKNRAHIPRKGSSDRRSCMWEVIELQAGRARWLERRSLSDAMLTLFNQ